MKNLPKDQVNQHARDLQRAHIGIRQLKKDLRDSELQNEIIMLGVNQIISKFTRRGIKSKCTLEQLACSIIVQDLKTTIKVANTHINQIIILK